MWFVVRNFVQIFTLAALVHQLLAPAGADIQQEGIMEDLFFGEGDILPDLYDEASSLPGNRFRRQADVSGQEFASFMLTLVGAFTPDQRNPANLEFRNSIQSALETLLKNALPEFQITVTVDTLRPLSGRRKRQTNPTSSIEIEGEISFVASDLAQMLIDLSRVLQDLNWGEGLLVSGQTLDVQLPKIARQADSLMAAVCYLCQNYETCEMMTNSSWFCSFQDDRFYAFGVEQGDTTLDKARGQTAAKLSIEKQLPYVKPLYSDVWLYTKTDSNTAQQENIFRRANADVLEYGFENFDASDVIVVTWDRVLNYYGSSDNERASFQATIITNGIETFMIFTYGHRALTVVPTVGNRISVGWGVSQQAVLDTQANYFRFDSAIANTGKSGLWFFKIGETLNSRAQCINWFSRNIGRLEPYIVLTLTLMLEAKQQLFIMSPGNRFNNIAFAPRGCPCSRRLAANRPWWIQVATQPNCFDLAPRRNLIFGRRCCYLAFQWGDPHTVSLDGKQFTFNNVGEFVLLNIQGQSSENVTLDVQAQVSCQATSLTIQIVPRSLCLPHCAYLTVPTSLCLPHCAYLTVPASLCLPHCACLTVPASLCLPHCSYLTLPTSLFLPHSSYLTVPTSLCLPHCAYLTVPDSLCLIHCACLTVPTSLCLPHCAYLTVPTSLCLPHCAYLTVPTSLCLPHCAYLTVPTSLCLPHCAYLTVPTSLCLPHCAYLTVPTSLSR
ncbi:hypothetical protein EGW08_005983 [Elysia chlorotica]|uniref:NIDO domain-containing protein n=1 Tax=Elysia chlorotica TaxID=188477 RepID=A0A433TXA4_ELYCH|nr:hypothetical protein EGW08_005983 [Elysia chlorotica]